MNHEDVAQDILTKRRSLQDGISYISDNATDRELDRLKDIFEEMDQSLWDAAAQRCRGDLVTRIQDARNNYTEYIAVNNRAPANWNRVKKALNAFEDGLSSIQVPQALFKA
ncbi:uncharacterized protein PG998_013040 [Apiospora kogelbergensis]|uniref:uncharacterized protein n=1 Tax=Apiospora kogelbergensis TaxID=1337665 RepID=UPI00312ED58F